MPAGLAPVYSRSAGKDQTPLMMSLILVHLPGVVRNESMDIPSCAWLLLC